MTTMARVMVLPEWERERVPVEEVGQWVQAFSSGGSLDVSGVWALGSAMWALHWEISAMQTRARARWWFEHGPEIAYGLQGLMRAGNHLLMACDDWRSALRWASEYVEGFAGSVWVGWIRSRQGQLMQAVAEIVYELQSWSVMRGAEMPEEVVAWMREQEQQLAGGGQAGEHAPGSYGQ